MSREHTEGQAIGEGAKGRPLLKKGQQVLVLATVQQDFGDEIAVSLEDWWPSWSEILVSSHRVTPLPVRTVMGAPLQPASRASPDSLR